MGHGGTDDDGDQDPDDDEINAQGFQHGEQSIGEQDRRTRYPCANEITHQNVPFLDHKVCVEGRVHGNSLVSQDGRDGGAACDPTQKVPPPRKPATRTSIFSGGDCRPVIYCCRISFTTIGRLGAAEDEPPLDDGTADANSAMEAAIKQ